MTQLDLFSPSCGDSVRRVGTVALPWMDYSRPFHWRRNQLQREAERLGEAHISFRSGEYGRSLVLSANIRDTFYRHHSQELWPVEMRAALQEVNH